MDTVLLVTLLVVLVLIILLIYMVGMSLKVSTKLLTTKVPPANQTAPMTFRDQMWAEQVLENRRLVNLLLARNPVEFQQMAAVNPENVGTSPVTNPPTNPPTYLGSDNAQDLDTQEYEDLGDQGFDEPFGPR